MIRRRKGEDAYERLYHEHAEGLLAFLSYQTGDRVLAEDILADTFVRVLTNKAGWRGGSSEKTWLYAIALNRTRDLARRRGAERSALDRMAASTPAPPSDMARVDDRDALHRGLAALSDQERVAVALRFGGELTLQEIADLIGESRSTAEARLYRGLKRLRGTLDEHDGE